MGGINLLRTQLFTKDMELLNTRFNADTRGGAVAGSGKGSVSHWCEIRLISI